MKNNDITEKEMIKKIEISEEYQKFCGDNNNSKINEISYSELANDFNIASLYFRETKAIPLLTEDEEINLGYDLKLIDKLSIVTKESKADKYGCFMINLPLVFKSCCNNKYYKIIIESLLQHFQKSNIFHKNLYQIVEKYSTISQKKGRALNETELKEYFQIEKLDGNLLNQKELLTQVRDYLKYKNAFDKMFYSNLRLVIKIADKQKGNNPILDLINEGNIGLIIAVRKFDVSLGYRFSTYATYWIKRAIRTFVLQQRTMITIPFYLNEEFSILRKKIYDLNRKSNRILTPLEISKSLNIPLDKIENYIKYEHDYNLLSLDMKVTEDEHSTIYECIKDKTNIEDNIINSTLKQEIKLLYSNLTEKEVAVIKMRFGLDEYNENALILKEVSKNLGISIERARQIESKALTKMRKLLMYENRKALKEYIK